MVKAATLMERLQRTRCARFNARTKCFTTRPNRKCKGLHRCLKVAFFPDDDGKRTLGSDLPPKYAKKLGIGLDAKLGNYVRSGRLPKLGESSSGDLLLRLLQALHAWHLTPLATQVVVCDAGNRRATAVDLVCADESGLAVVVELKTGYERTMSESKGKMRGQAAEFPCTPLNQHYLQLAMTMVLLHKQTKLKPRRAMVIQVGRDGARKFDLPQRFMSKSHLLYKQLLSV